MIFPGASHDSALEPMGLFARYDVQASVASSVARTAGTAGLTSGCAHTAALVEQDSIGRASNGTQRADTWQ